MNLVDQWFEWFENRILQEFGQNIKEIEDYQPDVSPLVYCCLHHKKVPNIKREVMLSSEFKSSTWFSNSAWLKLKEIIENGKDINCYMSKSIKDWKSIDYLLYTCKIRHFHLYNNQDGGVRKELVFGVFTDDKFYVLCIGDHNDIYHHQNLIQIAENNWPEELFNYTDSQAKASAINSDDFKKFANHKKFQFNLISPAVIKEKYNSSIVLNNNQHTAATDFTLNGITYKKVPLKAYRAYVNEIEHIEKIENALCEKHKSGSLCLQIDKEGLQYILTDNRQPNFIEKIPFLKCKVICSLYDGYH